jgi:hypothetical protein
MSPGELAECAPDGANDIVQFGSCEVCTSIGRAMSSAGKIERVLEAL